MAEIFPDLSVSIIDGDTTSRSLLAERLQVYGVEYLGSLATPPEVLLDLKELQDDPYAENLISGANLLFVGSSLSGRSDSNEGNQVVGKLIRDRLAFPPLYYRYAAGYPFPAVVYGCSTNPAGGYATAIGNFNYNPAADRPSKLRSMLRLADRLIKEGWNELAEPQYTYTSA